MPNRIAETVLDDALAQSFPASDPLPMNPGTDSPALHSRIPDETLTDAVLAQPPVGRIRLTACPGNGGKRNV